MGKRNLHMIEELLERYFEGETSAAEEKQIRAFFASGEVPERQEPGAGQTETASAGRDGYSLAFS